MARTIATEYTHTYTSFSGCDIVCTFGTAVIGELQAISYSVTREKAPIYTMGSAELRSVSRGKRGIAGSLVFTVFDRDALIEGLKEHIQQQQTFHRLGAHKNMEAMTIEEWDSQMTDMALEGISGATATAANKITNNIVESQQPEYEDEIPPFDITISFANEYGQKATVVIYGVEILNESNGFSIDDVSSEKACTFIARRVEYMRAVKDDATSATGASK